MVLAVDANVSGEVMTSSPGPMSCESSARCSAAVHELTAMACLAPTYCAKRFSNSTVSGPLAHQPERIAPATASTSRSDTSGMQKGMNVSRTLNMAVSFCRRLGRHSPSSRIASRK